MREGDGLRSQEMRCREYAKSCGYEVQSVFYEEGLSGSLLDRKAMDALLLFLKKQHRETIVVIEDLKRFARDVSVHFDLKLAIDASGGRLESPLFRFEDTPEGRFIETIVAAQAELERNQNRRQVKSRMLSRLEQGYWVFAPPPGYSFQHDPAQKQVLCPNDKAPVITLALEGFAAGRFTGMTEIVRFLLSAGYFGAAPSATARHLNLVHRMLRQALYTGSIEYAPWKITLREGKHKALISWQTFERIQERLDGTCRTQQRIDVREEFPLRGLVACVECGRSMTASWSRGERRRYPYYHCGNRQCGLKGKTIPKRKIEDEFVHLLKGLETSEDTMDLMAELIEDQWQARRREQGSTEQSARQSLKKVTAELEALTVRLAETESLVVAGVLERKIEQLENQRARLARSAEIAEPAIDVRTVFSQVRDTLKNPFQTWERADVTEKRFMVGRVFSAPLVYDRNGGYRTGNLTLPYRVLGMLDGAKSRMVDPPGKSPNCADATTMTNVVRSIDWETLIGIIADWTASTV